jgi:hypothetical protein
VEFLPDNGHAVPSESGETMTRRPRRNHTPAFKAKVALAVEEPAFLVPVHRIVGRIEIKDDLARRLFVRLQEQVDQKPFDGDRCEIASNNDPFSKLKYLADLQLQSTSSAGSRLDAKDDPSNSNLS